jgi:predicted ATPase
MTRLSTGAVPCHCRLGVHATRFIVLTGGPSAGKTAVLETVLRSLCTHLAVLPESASIVFGGGFPRHASDAGRRAAQRAIYHVQLEVERLVAEEGEVAIALCDRGTLDGLAYWPDSDAAWLSELGTSLDAELVRYAAVIHLRTPAAEQGYDASYALRIESPAEAAAIDAKIAAAWSRHPCRFVVESADDFLVKVARAVELVRAELPVCCRRHFGSAAVGDDGACGEEHAMLDGGTMPGE